MRIHEHFEPNFNAALATQAINQRFPNIYINLKINHTSGFKSRITNLQPHKAHALLHDENTLAPKLPH